jgi:hypothetical protein
MESHHTEAYRNRLVELLVGPAHPATGLCAFEEIFLIRKFCR